jgi:hypothetical protein
MVPNEIPITARENSWTKVNVFEYGGIFLFFGIALYNKDLLSDTIYPFYC